ncbi:MAG: hypothetical protein J6I49_02690 [Bacteroidales bacterium]|nr:hypothetical protein [Bacteroidales bacterium]
MVYKGTKKRETYKIFFTVKSREEAEEFAYQEITCKKKAMENLHDPIGEASAEAAGALFYASGRAAATRPSRTHMIHY